MADTKISELGSATSLTDTDVLAGVNSGTTKKFTLANIKEYFQEEYDGVYALVSHTHSTLSNGSYTVSIPSTIKKNESLVLQSEKVAEEIEYSNTSSGMDAENVQQAVDELNNKIESLTITAENITYDNEETGYTAGNVQAAIDEAAGLIATNTANIATNTANIVTNKSNIATNTSNISANTTAIETNTANIATNTSAIAAIEDSKGQANGYASLDASGEVPVSELPTFVSDISVTLSNMTITIAATTSK